MSTLAQLLEPGTIAALKNLVAAAEKQAPPMLQAERDAGLQQISYVTIPDVEIAFVGMNWNASTGPTTLTLEHLADACRAANDDPHILPPRTKIGHTDPRFNEEEPIADPFAYQGMLREDGTPAYGRFANLQLKNDGASLRGDWVECPDWMAAAAPSAWPTRSLEGDWDVETPGGKRYSLVLTAVAIGGEWRPAVACLEDLIRLVTGGPDAIPAAEPIQARSASMPVNAAASVDAVIRQFWNDFAQGDRYWWWPVDVWVEPNQVIADDDEGHLFRVPFTTDTDGNVTFDDPVHVQQEFRDLPAVAASMQGELATRFASASLARPRDRVRATTANEGSTMTDEARKTLAVKIGLSEDATQEQIDEKLRTDALAEADPDDTDGTDDEPVVEEPAAAAQPVAASVDPQALAQLQEDARLGREAREQQLQAAREQLVTDRIKAGAITAASKVAHLAELAKGGDIEKTHQAYLEGLTAGVIPVTENAIAASSQADHNSHQQIMASFGTKRALAAGKES